MDALASQIKTQLDPHISNLQVDGRMMFNPTPPAIDIYPGDPFQDAIAFGKGNNEIFLTVRARAHTADHEAGQDLLLAMMDPEADESVAQAILSDRTVGGQIERLNIAEGPSGYGVFPDPSNTEGTLLGCLWRVRVIP